MLEDQGWLYIQTLLQGSLPGSGDFHQPQIWALWEQMLGWLLFVLLPAWPGRAGGSRILAGSPGFGAQMQPRALSQWFPWQPSHPASSLQCQEIKQDDTTAPQKEKEKKENNNNTPEKHQQPVSSFPQPTLLASSSWLPASVGLCLCPGRGRKHFEGYQCAQEECWRAGKWLLCKLWSGPWSNFGQVPPCLFPDHMSGLAVNVGSTTGKGV